MGETRIIELADGRELAWEEGGDPEGKPFLAFHGTPGSRKQVLIEAAKVAEAGVRLIAVDRPGYGHSTFQPDRKLTGWARDVEKLADHLGLDHFGVAGTSGGGPHSLVCAALLPGRVDVAGVLSGVGPIGEPGSEEGMMPANVFLSKVGRRTDKPLRLVFGAMAGAQRRWPDRVMDIMIKQMPPPDAAIAGRPEVRSVILREAQHPSPTAARAAAQDFQLFAQDWGFALEDIKVPVHFWQGDADRNVPVAHARLMAAAVPDSTLHEVAGAGHFVSFDLVGEIFATLAPYVS